MKISTELALFLLLALGIGVALTIQTTINTRLREYLESPLQAALFSFLIGTIALAILVSFQTSHKLTFINILHIPWYLWIGGCLGAYAISMSIYTAPKLGLLTLSGLIIFGQIVTSILIDHFGVFGLTKTPINWSRIIGSVVIFIGVLLTLQR